MALKIDFSHIDENGTLHVFATSDWENEYPFSWHYKLYHSPQQNIESLLEFFDKDSPCTYEISPKLKKFLKNRIALYNEVSEKFLPTVLSIENSALPKESKKILLKLLDEGIYCIYPYIES